MNAYELADKCGLWIDDYDFGIEVANMLRQQADEIKVLKSILENEGIVVGKDYLNDCIATMRKTQE